MSDVSGATGDTVRPGAGSHGDGAHDPRRALADELLKGGAGEPGDRPRTEGPKHTDARAVEAAVRERIDRHLEDQAADMAVVGGDVDFLDRSDVKHVRGRGSAPTMPEAMNAHEGGRYEAGRVYEWREEGDAGWTRRTRVACFEGAPSSENASPVPSRELGEPLKQGYFYIPGAPNMGVVEVGRVEERKDTTVQKMGVTRDTTYKDKGEDRHWPIRTTVEVTIGPSHTESHVHQYPARSTVFNGAGTIDTHYYERRGDEGQPGEGPFVFTSIVTGNWLGLRKPTSDGAIFHYRDNDKRLVMEVKYLRS